MRPEHEGFKLGVYKAQKAIENAIGAKSLLQPAEEHAPAVLQTDANANITKIRAQSQNGASSRARTAKSGGGSRLLRELAPDKVYLEGLLKNPNLRCRAKEGDDRVVHYIRDAVEFLDSRQEFWRQQLPPHLK